MSYFSSIGNVNKAIRKVSALMIITGKMFLSVEKKNGDNRIAYFVLFGKITDMEPGFCYQMGKAFSF